MNIKKISQLFASTLALLLIMTSTASAFCRPFWNPTGQFDMEGAMKVFVHHRDNVESVIVQPAYKGTIKDFSLVFATPNRPKVTDAPKGLFENLDSMTNPLVFMPMMAKAGDVATTAAAPESVTVHEVATAGDYTATILSATGSTALTHYLRGAGYTVSEDDKKVFDYYIAKGNWYFTALKVDLSKVTVNTDGKVDGLLSPIQITFVSSTAMLPMKLMAGNMGKVKMLVYTLSENGLFIPGVDVQYAKKLTNSSPKVTEKFDWNAWTRMNEVIYEPVSSILSRFSPHNTWLVRMGFDVDTSKVMGDLYFTNNIPGPVSIQNGAPKRFMPELLPGNTGIIAGTGEISTGDRYMKFWNGTKKLMRGARGNDVMLLQELLNQIVKPTTPIIADGVWGRGTTELVRQFQTQFGIKIDGVVGKQTRSFMQSLVQK
jgi:hypothetical protein